MTDIVEHLRNDDYSVIIDGQVKLVKWEAATEIERLRERVEDLETILMTMLMKDHKHVKVFKPKGDDND